MSPDLPDRVRSNSSSSVVEFIIAAIHGYTILAREPDLSADQRAIINNRIHYLAGHAWALQRGEPLTESRAKAIAEHFSGLPRSLNSHALGILK